MRALSCSTNRSRRLRYVAVVAGTSFGGQGGAHVRMTFAVPESDIEEGLSRMRRVLGA